MNSFRSSVTHIFMLVVFTLGSQPTEIIHQVMLKAFLLVNLHFILPEVSLK